MPRFIVSLIGGGGGGASETQLTCWVTGPGWEGDICLQSLPLRSSSRERRSPPSPAAAWDPDWSRRGCYRDREAGKVRAAPLADLMQMGAATLCWEVKFPPSVSAYLASSLLSKCPLKHTHREGCDNARHRIKAKLGGGGETEKSQLQGRGKTTRDSFSVS